MGIEDIIIDSALKLFPAGSEAFIQPYLFASLIISLSYFLALVFGNRRLKAPHFIEWVRILLHSILIFLFVIGLLSINTYLTSQFFPWGIIESIVPLALVYSIFYPFARIVLKTEPKVEHVFKAGYGVSFIVLAMTIVLDFGVLGGQIIRKMLTWTPTYAVYIPITALLGFMLVALGWGYIFFFTRLEKTFLKPKERALSNAVKHPRWRVIGVVVILLASSFVFAAFFFNDYSISEGTPTYVAQGYFGNFKNSGVLEKTVNVSLYKKFFTHTPFEACDGWNTTGDVGNDSLRFINSTKENFTVTCTKKLDNINATLSQAVCTNSDNYSTCQFSVDVVDVPFRLGDPETVHNFNAENITCSRIEVNSQDSRGNITDITEDVQNGYAAAYAIDTANTTLRIDYVAEPGILVLEYLKTSVSAKFDLSVTCYHG
jgi:hypothetical protein